MPPRLSTHAMKICIFFPFKLFPVAGTSVRALNFARALAENGNEVCIVEFVLGAKASRKTRVYDGFLVKTIVHNHEKLRKYAFPIYMATLVAHYLAEIRKLLRENQYDILQFTALEISPIGVLVRRLFGRSIVVDLHSSRSLELTGYMKLLFRVVEKFVCMNANAIIVPTQELKNLYCTWGIQPNKINVVENVVDIDRFKPQKRQNELRKILNFTAKERVVVFHGNLKNDYNIQCLQNLHEISKIVNAKKNNVRFLVVGPYQEKPKGTEDFVYTGYVDNLPDYLSVADLAVVPISMSSLGIRSRCLEYFACGVPAITTPNGATGLGVARKANVLIVRTTNQEIAETVVELFDSPSKLEEMRANCRKTSEKFDLEIGADQLVSVYKA